VAVDERRRGPHLTSYALLQAMSALGGNIGFRGFVGSYSTMLRGESNDIKVQEEMLQHSTIQSIIDTYLKRFLSRS
jgi:hypothetical protein